MARQPTVEAQDRQRAILFVLKNSKTPLNIDDIYLALSDVPLIRKPHASRVEASCHGMAASGLLCKAYRLGINRVYFWTPDREVPHPFIENRSLQGGPNVSFYVRRKIKLLLPDPKLSVVEEAATSLQQYRETLIHSGMLPEHILNDLDTLTKFALAVVDRFKT